MEAAQVNRKTTKRSSNLHGERGGMAFPFAFLAMALAGTVLVNYVPQSLQYSWVQFTISLARTLASLTGLTTTSHGDILAVNGFEMRIIYQCTAVHYILLAVAAMLASSWHSISYRLIGITVASLLLIAANGIRLLATGLAGSISTGFFNFTHEYLWVTIFILLTGGIWVIWDKGLQLETLKRRLPLLILSCTVCHILLTLVSRYVATFIVRLAVVMLKPFNLALPITFTSSGGSEVLSVAGGTATVYSLNGEIMVLSVYCGAILTGILLKEKLDRYRVIVYGELLFIFCAVAVVMDQVMIIKWGAAAANLFSWLAPTLMISALLLMFRGLRG
jgi:exosortase/archaeosortase family protein